MQGGICLFYLKEANWNDCEEEFCLITKIPKEENGFTNPDFQCTQKMFEEKVLPRYLNHAKGIDLPVGWVPVTHYFLWKENQIIGLFRIRHYLNETLKYVSGGHIGYTIQKDFRGKGYATKGVALAIEQARTLVSEDEIYFSVLKDNIASFKVQIQNGALLWRETETHFFTKIKK